MAASSFAKASRLGATTAFERASYRDIHHEMEPAEGGTFPKAGGNDTQPMSGGWKRQISRIPAITTR
jgi:hypothetical protein